jgi:hypothetical protein
MFPKEFIQHQDPLLSSLPPILQLVYQKSSPVLYIRPCRCNFPTGPFEIFTPYIFNLQNNLTKQFQQNKLKVHTNNDYEDLLEYSRMRGLLALLLVIIFGWYINSKVPSSRESRAGHKKQHCILQILNVPHDMGHSTSVPLSVSAARDFSKALWLNSKSFSSRSLKSLNLYALFLEKSYSFHSLASTLTSSTILDSVAVVVLKSRCWSEVKF